MPSYIRTEIKKRTGKLISEKGEYLGDVATKAGTGPVHPDLPSSTPSEAKEKHYTSIDEYKPTGNLGVYNQDMFARIFQKTQPKTG